MRRIVTELLMSLYLIAFLVLLALFGWTWTKGAEAEPRSCPGQNQAIHSDRAG